MATNGQLEQRWSDSGVYTIHIPIARWLVLGSNSLSSAHLHGQGLQVTTRLR